MSNYSSWKVSLRKPDWSTSVHECIDQTFTLQQILEHRHTFRRRTTVVFLDIKAEFDFVDH